MERIRLEPNTTLYPVPVVLITCGAEHERNVFSLNRISSCNAEPPMVAISVRPGRVSHGIIAQGGEFVVNIPWPDLELVSDFVGTTTVRDTDKWAETGLTPLPAAMVKPPLLAECPVNLECAVRRELALPSHSLFIGEVVALHANRAVLNERGDVDYERALGGLPYRAGAVRERPVARFHPDNLRRRVHDWRDRHQ